MANQEQSHHIDPLGSFGQVDLPMLACLVIVSTVVSNKVHNLYLETEARKSCPVEKNQIQLFIPLITYSYQQKLLFALL